MGYRVCKITGVIHAFGENFKKVCGNSKSIKEGKIKSFFFVFPLFIICFLELAFSSSDFMLESCYFLGFLTTNTFYCSPKQYDNKKSLTALARLENLARLKEQGMLTDEDFRTKKAEIMEQM